MGWHYILLPDHSVVMTNDIYAWAEMYESPDRIVDWTGNSDVYVSTVFLGIDHNFGIYGPPLLFETMVFGGAHDNYMDRYSTWNEAQEGHKRMCERVFVRAGVG
jgi:hypothetical protein